MPWYWSDDLAHVLLTQGLIDEETATAMSAAPVAVKRDESNVEVAARAMQEDDEIPLAA